MLAATLGDWHEAEDALQEVLWRAFRHLSRLREPAAFDAWLRTVALRTARNRLQSELARVRREGNPAGDAADLQRIAASVEQVAVAVDEAESVPILDAIAGLPPLQRRVGHLAWVAGVPPAEIARLLGMSTNHVHVTLHRARGRLAGKAGWAREARPVPVDAVRIAGYTADRWVEGLRVKRPDLRLLLTDAGQAHVVALALESPPPLCEAPAPPTVAEAVPLDGMADASAFDMEPFGNRILRHTWRDRPYRLPHHARLRMVVYNAQLLRCAGLPVPPPPDWTWDEFFRYCRRCIAAGIPALACGPAGGNVARVAEQLGATADNLDPVRDAVAFVREWRAAVHAVPAAGADTWDTWYRGRGVFDFMLSAQPARGFEAPGLRPFPWGIVPFPRFRRSDPHVAHWTRVTVAVRGSAPDPVGAFAAVRALFTDGPEPAGGELPAYRTAEAMRAWRAQALPLGKECLLEVDAACGPLYKAAHLAALPGAGAVFMALAEGGMDVEEGLAALRRCVPAGT